jgi:hypothetical protein
MIRANFHKKQPLTLSPHRDHTPEVCKLYAFGKELRCYPTGKHQIFVACPQTERPAAGRVPPRVRYI